MILKRIEYAKRPRDVGYICKQALAQLIALIFLVPLGSCGGPNREATPEQPQHLAPGDYEREIKVGGMDRYYAVHVPPSYDKSRPAAVILNFHGGGGNPKGQRRASLMDTASDRFGFIAVYPQGTNRPLQLLSIYTWNAGMCCGWAMENDVDDVAYTAALLDDLSKVLNVDSKRVYATGLSNGAMMCYRLACDLSDRIAAIAPVSGPMEVKESKCRPSRPISIMHFHGTKDEYAPIDGGRGEKSLPGQDFTSVHETMDFWLKFLDIKGPPKITERGDATGEFYGPGREGAEVVLWKIKGGGHTWPGGQFGILGKRVLGKMTQDISATDLMWKFFEKHPLVGEASSAIQRKP